MSVSALVHWLYNVTAQRTFENVDWNMSPEAVAMRDKRISSLPAPSATSRGEMVKKVQIPDRISSLKRSRLSRQSLWFWSRRCSIT